ncbi:MAG: peptide chain release factor N(5)-glutamine methyltransferase [Eubacteriales bacterium]
MPDSALNVLKAATRQLRQSDISEAELDAKYIVSYVLGVPSNALYTQKSLIVSAHQQRTIARMLKKRIAGEPLQYIIGNQEFYGLVFNVNSKVLIPRPETELLVERALEKAEPVNEPRILDLCTGSGCIAVTLKTKLPHAKITASDISSGALRVARRNARQHQAGIRLLKSDLFGRIKSKFDIIVSNPPYISASDYRSLDRKVRAYEPKMALLSGESGLDAIQSIIKNAKSHLCDGGWLLMEIGHNQRKNVEALMEKERYSEIHTFQDYSGFDRIVIGRKLIF